MNPCLSSIVWLSPSPRASSCSSSSFSAPWPPRHRISVLSARIANEDRRAFTILMRRHGKKVRGLALAFGGKAADADDVTQDVFIMLWRRPNSWQPGKAAFTTWLYRVGRQLLPRPGAAAACAPLAPVRSGRPPRSVKRSGHPVPTPVSSGVIALEDSSSKARVAACPVSATLAASRVRSCRVRALSRG
jgi:hypothetical protein